VCGPNRPTVYDCPTHQATASVGDLGPPDALCRVSERSASQEAQGFRFGSSLSHTVIRSSASQARYPLTPQPSSVAASVLWTTRMAATWGALWESGASRSRRRCDVAGRSVTAAIGRSTKNLVGSRGRGRESRRACRRSGGVFHQHPLGAKGAPVASGRPFRLGALKRGQARRVEQLGRAPGAARCRR
jgi:hypothetical protein